MTKKFPIFKSHEEVGCFNCGGDLGTYWFETKNAIGSGHFVQECEKCRMATWYDLAKPTKRQEVYDELVKYVDPQDAAYAADKLIALYDER